MTTINYRIHPAIGIARVGTSDEYYIAPETVAGLSTDINSKTTGGLPIKAGTESDTITSSDIRDAQGGLKKQAARFKIYQYTLDSNTETYPMALNEGDIEEITIGSVVGNKKVTNIIWTVHLANKKANTFVLVEDPNAAQGISGYENGMLPPIRNADINIPNAPQPPDSQKEALLNNPTRVKQLSIDPGPRTISGPSIAAVNFDSKTDASYWNGSSVETLSNYPKSFPSDSFADLDCPTGALDSLGELQTDSKGRLLVLGGNGIACSWGQHQLDADVNNDQWFDDESDGPVYAVIEFDDGSIQVVEGSAWVACTDPSYAPQTLNIVPLFDDIYNSWVQQLDLSPDLYANGDYVNSFQPHFDDHLNPIFKSVALQKWNINLNSYGISNHDKVGTITAADDPSTTGVFSAVRNPNDPSQFGTLGYMPLALGDANESMLAVTQTQYFYISQWNSKNYQAGNGTKLGPGELLDKNTLMNCLGGRFSPGIDLTFTVRQPDIYVKNWSTSGTGPFRIKPFTLNYQNLDGVTPVLTEGYIPLHTGNLGLEPGDMTKFLAIPWQTDYNSCATHLPSPNIKGNTTLFWSWPAQRPVAVYVAEDVAANGGKLTNENGDQLQQWSVRGDGTSTSTSPAQDWGRYQENLNILKNWQNIGVVMQGSSIDPAHAGPADSSYYLEVASLLKEGNDPTNPVEAYPNINGKLPK
jgi:hypothetical protein